jgi:hypothetical protein
VSCHSERSEEPAFSSSPAPPPHTPLPSTSAEFVQHVVAGLVYPVYPELRGEPRRETGSLPATPHVQPAPPSPQPTSPPPQTPPTSAHAPSPTSAHSRETPTSHPTPSSSACHPERSEGSHLNHVAQTTTKTPPIPDTQPTQSAVPPAQPACPEQSRRDNPPPTTPSTSPREPNRDAPWLHFGDSRHIRPDSKLL